MQVANVKPAHVMCTEVDLMTNDIIRGTYLVKHSNL